MNDIPISLIIVAHQEAESIELVVREFYDKVLAKIPGSEFIVCEDGSTDGTKEILSRLEHECRLTLDMREGKRGYTQALRDGLALAKNPVIFFSDSDGQHDPDDFWRMCPLLKQYDLVVGWKKDRADSAYRLALTYIFNKLTAWYFGVKLHDIDCGFRLMKKPVADFLTAQPWRLTHCVNAELTVKAAYAGFKVAELPVSHFARRFGQSRGLPFKKLPKIIWHILKQFLIIKRDVRTFKQYEFIKH